MPTDIPCPTCGGDDVQGNENGQDKSKGGANVQVRGGKRGLWLGCPRFPKCRGRVGFTKLEEDVQADLEKRWKAHVKANPVPEIWTTSGHVIQEGEEYVPVIQGAEAPAEA